MWEAAPAFDENAVTESAVTTLSSSLFLSATVLTKNELLYWLVLLLSWNRQLQSHGFLAYFVTGDVTTQFHCLRTHGWSTFCPSLKLYRGDHFQFESFHNLDSSYIIFIVETRDNRRR